MPVRDLPYSDKQLQLVANTIRMLSADGVEKANSGHPGMPMGMADIATVLWLKYLNYQAKDPKWLNRDRFVLSNGHGSMLLYSLLHLSGYDVSLSDLQSFRQWGSKTPGHPECFMTAGVECTTGPLGQGISNSVGMAIGAKLLAERYNTADTKLIDHNIFVFAGDGCLMEGVSSEACSVAGHLGLGNLIVVYDDNHITIAGDTELAFTEDVKKRYESYGWFVQEADGHDFESVDRALERAIEEKSRPSLIAARTIIGKGSPNKAGSHDVHGSPLGKVEMELTKKNLGWPTEPTFFIPDDVRKIFAERAEKLSARYEDWKGKLSTWSKANPEKSTQLAAQVKREVPADLSQRLIAALPKDNAAVSTRKLSGIVLQALSKNMNSLVGGSADLEPSTLTLISGSGDVEKESFGGKNLRFGVREHGMGALMNGLTYYGAFLPYGSTFFCFADYMRPTLRLAALSHLPGLFIFTHDSVFLGEDGPTHQPIEHLAALRVIPNLWVLRPADGLETAMAYSIAARRSDGPCALIFTRQNLPVLERSADFVPEMIEKGAYTLWQSAPGEPSLVLVGSGSEVSLALDAAKKLSTKQIVRVVSMPCCELFAKQSDAVRAAIIPPKAKKVVVEAGRAQGWLEILRSNFDDTLCVTIEHYGASAPASILAEKFGLTPDAVAAKIQERFAL